MNLDSNLCPIEPPRPPSPRASRVRLALAFLISGSLGCLPGANDIGETTAATDGETDTTAGNATTTDEPGGSDVDPGPGDTTDAIDTDAVDTDAVDTDAVDTEGTPQDAFACQLEEPCTTAYFGCTSHVDNCEEDPPPVWGPGALCVLELARDIRSMPGASVEINFDRGGSPDWTMSEETYLLTADGGAIGQRIVHDEKFGNDIVGAPRLCTLQEPEYFQSCLDDPQWECGSPSAWLVDCVDAEQVECPGP